MGWFRYLCYIGLWCICQIVICIKQQDDDTDTFKRYCNVGLGQSCHSHSAYLLIDSPVLRYATNQAKPGSQLFLV